MAESYRTSIVLQKLANALTCKICNSITDDPHTVGGCGHFACRDCLLSLKISKCPMCNEQFYPTDLVPDVVVRTVLQEWRVISNLIDDKSTKRQCEKYDDTENKINKKEKALKTKSINISSSSSNKLKDSSRLNGKEKHKHDDEFKENKLKTHVVVNNNEDKPTVSNEFEINNDENYVMRNDNDLKNKQLLNEKENKVKMTNNVKDICVSPFNALKLDNCGNKGDDTKHKNILADKQVSKNNPKKDDLLNPKVLKINIPKISDVKVSEINVNKAADLKQSTSEKEESIMAIKESGINKTKIGDNKKSASNKETIYSKDSTKSTTNKKSIDQLESIETDQNIPLFSFDCKVTPPVKKYPSKKVFKSASKKKLVSFNISTDSDEDFNGFDVGKVNDSLKLTNKTVPSKQGSDNFSNKVKILTDKKVKSTLSKLNKNTTDNDNFKIKSNIKKDLVTNDDSISSSCEIITATPQENHDDRKESRNCRLKKRSVSTESLKSNSSEVSATSKNSVSKKKDVKKLNKKGETPLQVACTKGNLDAVKALLDEGANPNTKDYAGWTPLHEAVFKGNLSLVNLLLNAGAYINTPGYCNITPLLEAVIKDNVEIARILLQHGADITLRSRYNYLPMQCAESDEMKKLLSVYKMKNTISCNISDGDCNMPEPTALHGTFLNDDQTKMLTKFCKQFSITYFDTFRAGVSHVVVNDNGTLVAPPDPSVLRAIVNGIALISFTWIERCSKENRLLMPDEWEIKGTTDFPNSKAPIKSRYSNKKLLPRLFDGLHIFLWTNYWPKSEKLTKSFVNDLIRDGGAAILSREPDAEAIASDEMTVMFHADINGPMAVCSHVILYVKGPNEPQLKYNMKHIKTLPLTWLLESIQTYSIVNPV